MKVLAEMLPRDTLPMDLCTASDVGAFDGLVAFGSVGDPSLTNVLGYSDSVDLLIAQDVPTPTGVSPSTLAPETASKWLRTFHGFVGHAPALFAFDAVDSEPCTRRFLLLCLCTQHRVLARVVGFLKNAANRASLFGAAAYAPTSNLLPDHAEWLG